MIVNFFDRSGDAGDLLLSNSIARIGRMRGFMRAVSLNEVDSCSVIVTHPAVIVACY